MTTRHVKSSFFFDVISSFDKQENCANFLINFLAFLMSDKRRVRAKYWYEVFFYLHGGWGRVEESDVKWWISRKFCDWVSFFSPSFPFNLQFQVSFGPLLVQTFPRNFQIFKSRVTPKFHSQLPDRFIESMKKLCKLWRA